MTPPPSTAEPALALRDFQRTLAIEDPAARAEAQAGMLARLNAEAGGRPKNARLLGQALRVAGRLGESRAALEAATARWPADASLALDLAETLFWADRWDEAIAVAGRLAEGSRVAARARSILTRIAGARRDAGGVRMHLPAADNPTGRQVQALVSIGDFAEAYERYWNWPQFQGLAELGLLPSREAVRRAARGEAPLQGRTVVVGVHGLGDTLRFSQLYPEIAAACEHAVFAFDARLEPLFRRSFPGLAFQGVTPGSGGAAPEALAGHVDADLIATIRAADRVVDVKHFLADLRGDPARFAKEAPLKADGRRVAAWRRRLAGERPRVGLFWRSTLLGLAAMHKATRLETWLAATERLPIRLVALQYDLTAEERELIAGGGERFVATPGLDLKRDVDGTAALMRSLDLIVALPGTTQHLAGAVGCEVLMPTHPFEAAWRTDARTDRDLWAPSVEAVIGPEEDGLAGGLDETARRLEAWLDGR